MPSQLPANLWVRDPSLQRAGELLERLDPKVRAVSFDFFDTLVWRLVNRPADLFHEVGRRLVEANLLVGRCRAKDFAALRRIAELNARAHGTLKDKNQEDISLAKIYEELCSICTDTAAAAAVESGLEAELCFPNPVMLDFVRHAKARGLRVLVISDMYLSSEHLRAILRANGCDPDLFELILTSSEVGTCKSTGNLFHLALRKLSLNAEQLLHIGDSLDADVAGARKAGLRACHYIQETPESGAILERESLLQPASPGQFSVNHLRLLAARHFAGESEEAVFGRSGAFLLGPLLTRFATWACQEFMTAGVRRVGAFMREGELLGQMLQREAADVGLPLDIQPLFINRKSTDLAAIGKLTADNLIDWLGRRSTLTVKTILADFGLSPADVKHLPLALEAKVEGAQGILQVAKCLFTPEIARRIEARSTEERRKVIDYLRPWLQSGTLGVCDIGYNASAQVQLKRILELEGIAAPMVGCYLITTEIAAKRVLEGLDVRTFLGSFGEPEAQISAFIRSPAFIEQAMVAPMGTTLGFQRHPDGTVTPILDNMPFNESLLERQCSFKEGVLHYQALWLYFRQLKPAVVGGSSRSSQRILTDTDRGVQTILARVTAYPLQAELNCFGAIPMDDHYYAGSVRTICGKRDRAFVESHGFARAAREPWLLWPQGAYQLQNARASSEFFSYAKAMLLNHTDSHFDSPRAEILVVLRTGTDPERLRTCLRHLAALSRRDLRRELLLVTGEENQRLAAVISEFAVEPWRVTVMAAEPQQSVTQLLNRAADHAAPQLLFFLNDAVVLPEGWDEPLLQAVNGWPKAGAILPMNLDAQGVCAAFPPAQCVLVRRAAFLEGRGLTEKLPLTAAFWNLLMEMRAVGWEWRALTELAPSLVAGQAPSALSSADQDFLCRQWPHFRETLDSLGSKPPVPLGNHLSLSCKGSFLDCGSLSHINHDLTRQRAAQPDVQVTRVGSSIPPHGNPTPAEITRVHDYTPSASVSLLTSIIILAHNQLEHTRKCLASLAAFTKEPHEIIVVDNGSTDATREYLQRWQTGHPNHLVVCNQKNLGFAAGNNQGLAIARGEFLVLLNNDTITTEGWLAGLIEVFTQHPGTGVLGPMSNFVSGPQLVPDVPYASLSEMPAFAAGFASAHRGQSVEVARAVGFCLAIRRQVIDAVGGLDECFGSGNFEDDDFCMRARLAGFGVRIAQGVFIHHIGSQTFKGARIDYQAAMLQNWTLFKNKWKLPADNSIEKGYRAPMALPAGVSVRVSLPQLQHTHILSSDGRCWSQIGQGRSEPTAAARPSPARPMILPKCALVGHLAQGRTQLGNKKYRAAWEFTVGAIQARPYHPEAYLLLAEIALASGDSASARRCAQHARLLAPDWKPAKRFLKSNFRGSAKPEWLVLPDSLAPRSTLHAPRLSVCLIVKDEEKFLDQCLASVRGLAAQIVIVDTGSTDRTVAIAKEHGAEVHDFSWCDDFSAARNAALEHATGDWVLMLDADEELPSESHEALRKLLAMPSVMAWRLPIVDVGRENEGCCYVPRLFRNAPALFYVGRVHEQVFTSIEVRRQEWGLDNRLGDATLRHHGYLPEIVKDRNKIERNLRLLEKAVVELPDEPNLLMNYGLELVRSGQPETGMDQYRRAFDLMSAQAPALVIPETREMLLTQLCTQLIALRRFDEIIRVLTSPLAHSGGLTASLHFALGLAHLELKQSREAADQMRQCLAKRGQQSLAPVNPEIHKAGPRHCLALCLAHLGQTDAAAEEFRLAIKDDPKSRTARFDYARCLAARNRPVEALNLLFELARQQADDSAVWVQGGQIALSRPEFLEVALDWTADAHRLLPQDLTLLRQRAEALTLANRCEEALPLWRQLRPESDPALAAALVLCETIANDVQFSPATQLEAQTSREFLKWYQRVIQFNGLPTIEAINARIDSLQSRLPTVAHILHEALVQAGVAAAA